MKKVFFCLAAIAMLSSCKDEKKADTPATATTEDSKPPANLAYPVAYSANFKIGNPEYSAMIVKGSWKDWEMNQMDDMKSWVADSIVAMSSNNKITNGLDSLQSRWKRSRADLVSVTDSIDAVISVRSVDKNEDWVLVWAREISENKAGKKDTAAIMETWRINKDGKADMVMQFDRATRKE